MIHLGTSGYSFRDWIGPFYPEGTRPAEMLQFYAQRFDAVEINSTYYRTPPPRVMAGMADRTPAGFSFMVKFHGDITHRRTMEPEAFEAFRRMVAPLVDAGKFRGALAQFPFAFRDTPENRDYLRFVRNGYGPAPLFLEFRHSSWAHRETFALCDEIGAGFCAVDEPRLAGLFPPIVRPTGPTGYVRLHGRNAAEWWRGEGSARYNYLYTDEELREWAAVIRELDSRSRDTFVFFNNCHAGRAAENALRMGELLQ